MDRGEQSGQSPFDGVPQQFFDMNAIKAVNF